MFLNTPQFVHASIIVSMQLMMFTISDVLLNNGLVDSSGIVH